MGIFSRQVQSTVTSVVVASTLPEEVNRAKEVVSDMLPENMKAALAVTSVAASIAYHAYRERNQEDT